MTDIVDLMHRVYDALRPLCYAAGEVRSDAASAEHVREIFVECAALAGCVEQLRAGTLPLAEFCDLYGLPEPGVKPFLDNPDVDSTHWDDSGRGCTRLPIPPDPAQEPPVERGGDTAPPTTVPEPTYLAAATGRREFRAAYRRCRDAIKTALRHLDYATPQTRNGPCIQAAGVLREALGLPPMGSGKPSDGVIAEGGLLTPEKAKEIGRTLAGYAPLPVPPDPAQEPSVERGSSWDFDIYHQKWVRSAGTGDPAQEPPVELVEQAPNDEIILRAALDAWFKAGGERCPEQAMRAALEAAMP